MTMASGVDVATLVIRVDATQLTAASGALANVQSQGSQTERALAGVGAQSVTAGRGVGQLNNVMRSLVMQATGADPIVGRLATVIGGFALSGVMMTGVLAGVAALGYAWRKMTEDARLANQAFADAAASLQKLAPDDGFAARRAIDLANLRARDELETIKSTDFTEAYRLRVGPTGEAAVAAAIERQVSRENTALNRVLLTSRELSEQLRPQPYEFTGPSPGSGTGLADMQREAEEQLRLFALVQMPKLNETIEAQIIAFQRANPAIGIDYSTSGISTRQGPMFPSWAHAWQSGGQSFRTWADAWRSGEPDSQADIKLAAARKAANDALITSLANVGRAYGGVTDQVLNLAAATMSIYQAGRLPGFGRNDTARSTTDAAVGYGSAALSGIGFGQSSGSPVLGGIGGAASGFAMTGPYGAIVGGVAGIVSGLLTQGERAREAARAWRAAFDDFKDLFDDKSPLDQRLEQNDDWLSSLSGGRSREEIEAWLVTWKRMGTVGDFLFNPEWHQRMSAQAATYRNLLQVHAENAKQADELNEAEKRLNDTRRNVLQALNAPAGLNLSLYGYRAAESGGSMTVQGDFVINVDGSGQDPKAIADAVFDEGRRRMKLGGTSPYAEVVR